MEVKRVGGAFPTYLNIHQHHIKRFGSRGKGNCAGFTIGSQLDGMTKFGQPLLYNLAIDWIVLGDKNTEWVVVCC